jgi:hypothetical protein
LYFQYGDDDVVTFRTDTEMEMLEYSAVNLGIALITASATVGVM